MIEEKNKKMDEKKEVENKGKENSNVNNKKEVSELKVTEKNEQNIGQTDEKKPEITKEEQKTKEEKKKDTAEKPKKTEVVIHAKNIPISAKHSIAIGKSIKGKKIGDAIIELNQVLKLKKAIPMRGEIPHRHGRGISGGRFPKKASESFIKLLKSLSANADYNGLENPVVSEVISNIGERPFGRFGAVRKKRTHIKIIARNKESVKKGENS